MTLVYHKVYTSSEGRKFRKYRKKKFADRKSMLKWLASNGVIVKDVRA